MRTDYSRLVRLFVVIAVFGLLLHYTISGLTRIWYDGYCIQTIDLGNGEAFRIYAEVFYDQNQSIYGEIEDAKKRRRFLIGWRRSWMPGEPEFTVYGCQTSQVIGLVEKRGPKNVLLLYHRESGTVWPDTGVLVGGADEDLERQARKMLDEAQEALDQLARECEEEGLVLGTKTGTSELMIVQ